MPVSKAAPVAPVEGSDLTVPLPVVAPLPPDEAPVEIVTAGTEPPPAPSATLPLPAQSVDSQLYRPPLPEAYPAPPSTVPYGAPYPAALAPVPAPHSSMTPILIGVGALVALAVAAGVLWQTGVLPGWLNIGSKTATSTVQPSVTPSTTVEKPPVETTVTPPPDGPVETALSETDSLDAINQGYTTVTRFEDQFAAKKTGWIWSVWSKKIDTKNDPAALSALADEAKGWVGDMQAKRDDFEALGISETYATYRQDLLHIFDLMITRATVYYDTTTYAVDHPTQADGTQPWRVVQDGTNGGTSASEAAAQVKTALAKFVLP